MSEDEVNEWRTGDTALAAFLIEGGHKCKRMEWENDSGYFTFDETDDMLDLVVEFMGDEAIVNPRTYNMTLSSLRRKMFKVRDQSKGETSRVAAAS